MTKLVASLVVFLASITTLKALELPTGRESTNSLGQKFVRIEAGDFTMGEGAAPPKSKDEFYERDYDETPAHPVVISKSFFLSVHEVTNAQFEQFDAAHKELRARDGRLSTDDQPVVMVTWQQANDFCAWLSKKEGRTYRLPTEAEWEYACRAGTKTKFSTGDTLSAEQTNFGPGAAGRPDYQPAPVGSYPANPWGVFDMHGNVAEWCLDWYGPYEAEKQTDPVGRVAGMSRVCRGGSCVKITDKVAAGKFCRSANRSGRVPDDADRYTGFRIVQGELPLTKSLPVALATYQQNVSQQPAKPTTNDAAKPLYINYPALGKNPKIPAESWGPVFSQHNHYAAGCVCPNGDVLAVWYTCVTEPGRELAQAASRLRHGSDTFEQASSFFDTPDVNDHAPVLFCDGKRIFHFFTQSSAGWDQAADCVRWSDDNGVTWTTPKIIVKREAADSMSQPCQAIRLKDGTLAVSCDGNNHKDERVVLSRDNGQTWTVTKGDMRATVGAYAIHPTLAQRDDGALISFLRGPNPVPQLISTDAGASWKMEPTKFPGLGTGQKATSLKLSSGALLLVTMDGKKSLLSSGLALAALSLDDGRTWGHARRLEGVQGYMAAAQDQSGRIQVIGTRMSCVTFNEAWLREGKPLDDVLSGK